MPHVTQLDLLFAQRAADRAVTARAREAAEEAKLITTLQQRAGWISRSAIALALGWSKHHVRRVAARTDQVVARIGVEGYKLLNRCTREEYDHVRNARRSQIRQMGLKVLAQDRIFFGRRTEPHQIKAA